VPLEEYADRLAAELHERVEHQRQVFKRALCKQAMSEGCAASCPLVDCPRLKRLRAALRETIAVLEQTRGAFKSKRLEVMRRKLTDLLTDG
jgi:hypothetical protein